MKQLPILFSIIIVVVATFGSQKRMALAADLCGGTGGNGEIVSIGSNTFTLKLNEGDNLIVDLTNRARIETSTGNASLSDLKMGDRVTLVGDSHRDGTFTADTVVLCNKSQQIGEQKTPVIVRNNDPNYGKVSGAINTVIIVLTVLIWINIIVFLRLYKRKSFIYLFFFTIFYIYLFKVLDYTLLQFQSLLFLKHFLPNLRLNGVQAGRSVNLIPLLTLTLKDVKTSLLNILMMMPFGFGLPFITDFRFKKVVIAGLSLSIVIEFLQLTTGFMANTTFRIADVNDLIFNTLGVAIGYILFDAFVRIFVQVSCNWKIKENSIWRYITERPQINKMSKFMGRLRK